ncbi:MAPEG family protein [Thalassovita aquimarina]|uniref:MAPEG family protein n=1 Tax=Thalassovita aquimarina TaxID=2785917 RepID=A0ABS5HS80_9RHOB|nr:MAPEG family protein [Thalassovita aquimarina]MBR9651822.1 MAPEG family protein [Thalassovita aquimarina]
MSIPIFALLGFALWTLVILFGAVGVYRWSRILTGRTRLSHWTADPDAGSGIYPRAMRAHMNCIENLPVFGAIVFAIDHMGLESGLLDGLAIVVLAARVVQSLIHILLEQSDRVILIRFGFYFSQIVAMIAMAVSVLAAV